MEELVDVLQKALPSCLDDSINQYISIAILDSDHSYDEIKEIILPFLSECCNDSGSIYMINFLLRNCIYSLFFL